MIKFFMATVVFTMLFAPSYSQALSDANYEFLKKESSEFTEADNQLIERVFNN